jgi:hypothetical protein
MSFDGATVVPAASSRLLRGALPEASEARQLLLRGPRSRAVQLAGPRSRLHDLDYRMSRIPDRLLVSVSTDAR